MVEEFTEAELEEIRVERREYMNEWRKNNPDKVQSYNKKYWLNRSKKKKEFTPMEWTEPIKKTPQK